MIDLAKKTAEELRTLLREQEESLRNFRFAISGSKTRNVKEGMNIRKDIARIKTKLVHLKG